ncbi:MAG TPA: M1 family aminopeptidase [Nitrososphaerales archaeon]|nr:M1 family aminopeptidase [Nitrososphaerales archaeon]
MLEQSGSFRLSKTTRHYPAPKPYRTEHIKVELRVDIEKKSIAGSCTLKIAPTAGELHELRLDACEMKIERVEVDGAETKFDYDNAKLSIRLEHPVSKPFVVSVAYSCNPRIGVEFVHPDAAHPMKEPQAWTQGEPDLSRYWYPCNDYPNDMSTSEMIISVPDGNTVVSNGKLLSKETQSGWTKFHWREESPHAAYLNSFAAGKFGLIEQEADGVPLSYYFPESRRKDALRYFGETPRMVEFFGRVTGRKYPYEKYAQVVVEDFTYGGMENISATTLVDTYFPEEGTEEDFHVSYSRPTRRPEWLVAHELAHQWFGDLVTCSDWSHAWLNEGFATYFQALYVEESRGVDEFRWEMRMKALEFFEEDATEYRRPIVEKDYVFPSDVFDLATYEKGAWMLHELRCLLGDDAFFRGIGLYVKRHAGGNAETHDLRRAMEDASGATLEEFFEQSFYRGGYPEFEVSYQWDDGARTVTVGVKQTQEGQPYRLECDLVFYTAMGRVSKTVWLTSAEQAFTFELDSRPSIVEFDPKERLLKKANFTKPLDLAFNQLATSEDASSRAEAARNLGAMKNGVALEALATAAKKEQFWLVRAEAIRAIGEVGGEAALARLLELGLPANRRVRRAVAEALGKFKDERGATVLRKLLSDDPSPYVRCEAALSLAKIEASGAFEALSKAMKAHSPNETLAEACLEAMGSLKAEGVNDVILKSLYYGNPFRVRIGALKAIKARGYMTNDELTQVKSILESDPDFAVRYIAFSEIVPALHDERLLDEVKKAAEGDLEARIQRKAMELLENKLKARNPS